MNQNEIDVPAGYVLVPENQVAPKPAGVHHPPPPAYYQNPAYPAYPVYPVPTQPAPFNFEEEEATGPVRVSNPLAALVFLAVLVGLLYMTGSLDGLLSNILTQVSTVMAQPVAPALPVAPVQPVAAPVAPEAVAQPEPLIPEEQSRYVSPNSDNFEPSMIGDDCHAPMVGCQGVPEAAPEAALEAAPEGTPEALAIPTAVPTTEAAAPTIIPTTEAAAPTIIPTTEAAVPTIIPTTEAAVPTIIPTTEAAVPTAVPVIEAAEVKSLVINSDIDAQALEVFGTPVRLIPVEEELSEEFDSVSATPNVVATAAPPSPPSPLIPEEQSGYVPLNSDNFEPSMIGDDFHAPMIGSQEVVAPSSSPVECHPPMVCP